MALHLLPVADAAPLRFLRGVFLGSLLAQLSSSRPASAPTVGSFRLLPFLLVAAVCFV